MRIEIYDMTKYQQINRDDKQQKYQNESNLMRKLRNAIEIHRSINLYNSYYVWRKSRISSITGEPRLMLKKRRKA